MTGQSVIALVLAGHRRSERMFAAYVAATDPAKKQAQATELVKEIVSHAAKEEMAIYSWMKRELPETADLVNHGLQEHQKVKEDLAKLEQMMIADAEFEPMMQRVWKDVVEDIIVEERGEHGQ